MFKRYSTALILSFSLVFSACNTKYNKLLNSNDLNLKFEKAKEYYNNGDYYKAIPLFEELITLQRGSADLEDIYYSYAYSHYGQSDYILAAYHFKNFINMYPRSEKAEDASFMIARCYYEQSPRYTLDQTATYQAIEQFQIFANKYPQSEKIPEVNESIDELRAKLHRKAYENAYLYYRLKNYSAASTAFANLVRDFPDSEKLEEAYYLIVKSNKSLADNSYPAKKLERYNETIESYFEFTKRFPESGYSEELKRIYEDSQKSIESLNKITDDERKQERGS